MLEVALGGFWGGFREQEGLSLVQIGHMLMVRLIRIDVIGREAWKIGKCEGSLDSVQHYASIWGFTRSCFSS